MKRSVGLLWVAAVLTGLVLVGCGKDSTGPGEQAPAGVSNEQSAMQYYAANDGFVANDELTFADKAIQPIDYSTFGKIDEAIVPLRFGRFVTNVNKQVDVEVQPGDTVSIAHIQKTVTGTLKIKGLKGVDTVTVEKPFTDLSERYIVFKRIDRKRDRYWMNWVPVASSLVHGGTVAPNNDIQLTKVEILLPGGKTITITEPEKYFLRYRWLRLFTGGRDDTPELVAGDPVTMRATVTSVAPDTDVVVLRYGCDFDHARRARMKITSQTTNPDGSFTRIYELAWQAHFHRGMFNAQIDAMTRRTLFDDAAAYAVSWWAVPYRVY
jgi:hypothetical protein